MKLIKIVTLLYVSLMLCVVFLVACEPMAPFKIKNDTDQTLNVFVTTSALDQINISNPRLTAGPVEPGETLRYERITKQFSTCLIEAIDAQGNMVYSQEFKIQELEKAKWKIVITSPN